MPETSTSLAFNADSFANSQIPAVAPLSPERELELRTAVAEMNELLESRGLRLDSRAKCVSGRILYWARVLAPNGREMASSLGWYEHEGDARLHALAMLQLIDSEVASPAQI